MSTILTLLMLAAIGGAWGLLMAWFMEGPDD